MNSRQGKKIYQVLRIAIAMCFIGHGAFGIITKPIWCNYFGVFGIGESMAYQLMPWVGVFDIALGIIILIYPVRAIAAWLVFWGLLTASLRPLSGEPFAELIERAGNFGAPLALLILTGIPHNWRGWFERIHPDIRPTEKTMASLLLCLRVLVFLLLLGHGWLNFIGKKGLLDQYTALGFSNAAQTAATIGVLEIIAAVLTLFRPLRPFILVLFIWKIVSELFYPHYEIFEWVERGGSYGCLLALWMVLAGKAPAFDTSAVAGKVHNQAY